MSNAVIEPSPESEESMPEDHSEPLAVGGAPRGELVPRSIKETPDVVMLTQRSSVAAERFRRLKTRLVNESKNDERVLSITSAAPDEGKSFVSLNLSMAFGAENPSTLLIDADLRRPSIQRWITPTPTIGLTELMTDQVERDHVLFPMQNSQTTILPAGGTPSDPTALLSSSKFAKLVEELRNRFDWILIDTPPVVLFSDADAVSANCDGVLLVVRAGRTPKPMFKQAIGSLTSAPVVGTVINDVTFNLPDRQSHYSGYYNWYYYEDRKK